MAKLSVPAPIIFPIKIIDEYLQHLLVRDLLNVFENGFYQFYKRSFFWYANYYRLICISNIYRNINVGCLYKVELFIYLLCLSQCKKRAPEERRTKTQRTKESVWT